MEEIIKENEKTDNANNAENTENTKKTGKLSSKCRAVIGIAAALVVIAGALIFFLGGSSAEKLQKQIDLGQKYLEEMNYEEAVVAFEAAIEIDPMSVDAYLGLVEVYIRTGDFDTALEYAKKGYEMTGDERLKEKMEMIESENQARELQKQINLGQKYLEEMNYEEAVVAFEAAIEIDPMSVDAYLGLVEVYIRTGDFDTALEYAKKGYEMTGDERLKEKIDMIESGNITASNGWTMLESYYDADGALLRYLVCQRGEQGREELVSLYNADGSLINEIDVQYNEKGKRTVDYSRYSDGTLEYNLGKVENEYDTAGNMIARREYKADGTLSSYTENEYDTAGNRIARREYNADGTLWQYDEYDTAGNVIERRGYNADGTLRQYDENEYDTAGNVIAQREYNADGTLRWYEENEYDTAGNMIARRGYNADGTLWWYEENEYDTAGNMIARREYKADGTLSSYTENEYDTAGNMIAKKEYNGDGNLELETRYD